MAYCHYLAHTKGEETGLSRRFPQHFYLTFPGLQSSLSLQTKYLSSYNLTLMKKVLKWQSLELLECILSLKLSSFTFKAKRNYLSCI